MQEENVRGKNAGRRLGGPSLILLALSDKPKKSRKAPYPGIDQAQQS